MYSIALHQWQGRPQPSLTHNLNVSVKEKAKKMFPVCGMFNMSRCWCLEAVNSLDTDKIPDCAFYTGEGTGDTIGTPYLQSQF